MVRRASMLLVVLFVGCATLPRSSESAGSANLMILKLAVHGSSVGAEIATGVPGGSSVGLSFAIHGGEAVAVDLKSIESGKTFSPTLFDRGFCYYANLPDGSYRLESATLDDERRRPLGEYGATVTVSGGMSLYAGTYDLTLDLGAKGSLERRQAQEEDTDREQVASYLAKRKADWEAPVAAPRGASAGG